MNLIDDFLFMTLISHEEYGPEAARYMLSTILQRPIGEVEVHAQKVFYGLNEEQHGIRMDAFIKEGDSPDASGSFYDLEPDKRKGSKEDLPLRTRYYHNIIDNRCLKTSEDYCNLRNAYVIMITSYDPFERNRMRYTIKNRCIEEPDLNYEDGALTIYLYVNGNPDGLPEDLIHLLRYMKSTTAGNAVGNLSTIHNMVEKLKQNKEVQQAEMNFHEIMKYEREEARKEGREEGRKEGREEGREEGRKEGRKEGQAEEHKNTLREMQRAASLEKENALLKEQLAALKKLTPS